MSCLGTSIPKAKWPIVLTEVRRILKTGGVVEIVDDEMIWGRSGYPPKEHQALDPEDCSFLASAESTGQEDAMHIIDQYFTRMLVERYGMPATPHRTVDRALEMVFGVNDKKHFRVELPSPDFGIAETEEIRRGGNFFQAFRSKKDVGQSLPPDTAAKAQRVLGSTPAGERISGPFLIFYPHGLCRLDASEVRMAACGTMHRVLSCRASLVDSVVGQDTWGEELDQLNEMLWDYERQVPLFCGPKDLCSLSPVPSFYPSMLDLPDDNWNDFGGECKGSGKDTPATPRGSSDSYDSGYASFQSSTSKKMTKSKKPPKSIASDTNDCTLVRCFRVFHATKV